MAVKTPTGPTPIRFSAGIPTLRKKLPTRFFFDPVCKRYCLNSKYSRLASVPTARELAPAIGTAPVAAKNSRLFILVFLLAGYGLQFCPVLRSAKYNNRNHAERQRPQSSRSPLHSHRFLLTAEKGFVVESSRCVSIDIISA
jgi:hypothetical protein